MDWELYSGGKTVGPASEADVLEGIRRGALTDAVMARPAGQEQWRSIRAHAPFAVELERALATGQHQTVPGVPPPMTKAKRDLLIASAAAVAVFAVGATVFILSSRTPPAAAKPAANVTSEPPKAEQPKRKEPSPAEQLMAIESFPAAVLITKAAMRDVANDTNQGGAMLALWGWKNGHWKDFAVAKDETTFARVAKDSDEERTKRLCASGSIIEIRADKFEGGKVDVGLLMNDSAHLFHFTSVASSGTLVQGSPARFCGVVTGKFDYSNSGGGTGHAVDVVGMFDLPENRKK